VIAQSANGRETLASTKTDGDGKYAFRNLPSDRVALTARRAGFYVQSAGGHDDRRIVLDCSSPVDCLGVDFELRQGAVISGRVVDELGEPVQDIRVQAQVASKDEDGRERRGASSTSDDRGIFRVAGLQPGDYTLRTEQRRRRARPEQLPSASLPVTLGEGEHMRGVELMLQEPTPESVETFSVAGRVTGVDLTKDGARFISARARRSGRNARVAENGSFTISGLRPGNYQFRYNLRPNGRGGRSISDSAFLGSVDVSGDIANLVLGPAPPTGLNGRLVIESGEPYDIMTVWLIHIGSENGESMRATAPEFTFGRKDLQPGEYRIRVSPRFRRENLWFVKEIRVGGEPSEAMTVRVTEGVVQDVDVVLSADFSTIHGRVKAGLDGGQLRKGAQYIVGLRGDGLTRTVQADQLGRFSFDKVAAGDYKIGAWEGMTPGRVSRDETWAEAGPAVREFPVDAGSDIELDLTAVRQ
jgi:hypothetical protein